MAQRLPGRSRHRREHPLDLSFTPFDRAHEVTVLPHDLAVLMVGVAQRQAGSETAAVHWRLLAAADPLLFRPLHGAFNGPMAAAVLRWRQE